MEKFLHMTDFFSTSTACGACDKYDVYLFTFYQSLGNVWNETPAEIFVAVYYTRWLWGFGTKGRQRFILRLCIASHLMVKFFHLARCKPKFDTCQQLWQKNPTTNDVTWDLYCIFLYDVVINNIYLKEKVFFWEFAEY